MIVTLIFPADMPCGDKYCPVNEYGQHSHSGFNAYDIPQRDYVEGMSVSDAAKVAISVRFNESVNNTKGVLENV